MYWSLSTFQHKYHFASYLKQLNFRNTLHQSVTNIIIYIHSIQFFFQVMFPLEDGRLKRNAQMLSQVPPFFRGTSASPFTCFQMDSPPRPSCSKNRLVMGHPRYQFHRRTNTAPNHLKNMCLSGPCCIVGTFYDLLLPSRHCGLIIQGLPFSLHLFSGLLDALCPIMRPKYCPKCTVTNVIKYKQY